jgi:YidC/Oxa1 family membrane protein insertase
MHVLGINLADSVRTHQPHLVDVLPYALLVLIAVGLQYVSIWQVTNRNPAASASNQQMQQMQKYMPLIFLVLYIALPAGVGVYFIVSSLFRVGQQEWMYKHDPTIVGAIQELTKRKHADALNPSLDAGNTADSRKAGSGSRDTASGKGFLARMREASGNSSSTRPTTGGTQRTTGASGSRRSATNGSKTSVSQNGSKTAASAKRPSQQQTSRSGGSGGVTKSQPRSRDKRPRKGR